jgi:hypothetical protein
MYVKKIDLDAHFRVDNPCRGKNVTHGINVIRSQNHESQENTVYCIFIWFVILKANYVNSMGHIRSLVSNLLYNILKSDDDGDDVYF